MKRVGALFLAAVLGVSLSGCDVMALLPYSREIEDMALMRTMGVDVGQEDASAVTVTVSSGVQSQGKDKGDKPPVVVTGESKTISGACLGMQAEGSSYIFYGHVGQFLLGEALAAQSTVSALDYVLRDVEMRLDTEVYVVKGGTAKEAISTTAEDGTAIADRLDAMEEDAGLLSHSMPRTVKEVLADLGRNGSSFVPAIQEEQGLNAVGYAILKDGALAGWAQGDAADGINLLLGQVDADVIELPSAEGVAALRVVGAKSLVKPVFESGRLTGIAVSCEVEANLAEGPLTQDLRDKEQLLAMEAQLAQVEQGRVEAALALVKALDTDFLDLQRQAGLSAPWRWAAIQEQWKLEDLSISVQVVGTVQRSYDSKQ